MKELKRQLVGALLVVLTAAALISAALNFQQQSAYQLPDDGVTWVERPKEGGGHQVVALYVAPNGGGDRAGLKPGDVLLKIQNFPIESAIDATRVLARIGAWSNAHYSLRRDGVELNPAVIIRERIQQSSLYYQYAVGLCYLAIGLFVYYRRGRAAHARHFYALCLASFILSSFHYTGKLNNFDKVIYWGNVSAGLFAPTIFLHFCLAFPQPRRWIRGLRAALLYVPASLYLLVYFGFASGRIRASMPLIEINWLLDRGWLVFLSAAYLLGALVIHYAYRAADDPIVRQQLKWLRNGAVLGVLPFTCINVIPYLLGVIPGSYMHMAVLSLMLIPVTWAYAILRYRLMDVDVIFQQGFAYTLATLALLGVLYALILSIGPFEELPAQALVLLILVATFMFQPLRNWIQEQLDRYYFYKDRYDYRRTLIEFARELNAETDLDTMLPTVAERLHRTLYLKHVAFFVAGEHNPNRAVDTDVKAATGETTAADADALTLAFYSGTVRADAGQEPLDLSFLPANPTGPLFFEQTRHVFDIVSRDWPVTVRQTLARLDLTYYLPCSVRGRTIAWLGVSRTDKDDFLSSEDLELLATISGYIGIAIENARLYRSLQLKVAEYERLKEFSENIVESINVGIVAAALDDRVESWNSQMEVLTGVTREKAMGQPLRKLFPTSLVDALDQFLGLDGIHQVYKVPLEAKAWAVVSNGDEHGAASAGNGSVTTITGNGVTGNGKAGNGNGHASRTASRQKLVNIAIAPLVTKDQQQIGRLIIFDDITERAQLEQQLIQADKLSSIGLLAAGVAHEVNTPLAVISTYAQMLTKQISGDDPKSRLLDKIARQTFRASEIVNSLLNFSRTNRAEFEDLDLNRVIRETLTLVEHQLQKVMVRVEFSPEADLPPIRGNSGKMQQVFLNLFLNARDAMEEGGGVMRIATTNDGRFASVVIADNGKGIPAEELPRIYDPFFTTKSARKGTGLGLAVTYGIVREHNGSIQASSTPGTGTRFQLDFPLVRKPVNV
jgi:two-component system NtrC family sensor kinase